MTIGSEIFYVPFSYWEGFTFMAGDIIRFDLSHVKLN